MQTEDAPTGDVMAGSAPAVALSLAPRRSGGSAFLEWFLRRRTLAALRTALGAFPAHVLMLEHRARQAAELGRAALEPGEVREAGSADAVACELYRQAAYWALCALSDASDSPSLSAAPGAALTPAPSDLRTSGANAPPTPAANEAVTSGANEAVTSARNAVNDAQRPAPVDLRSSEVTRGQLPREPDFARLLQTADRALLREAAGGAATLAELRQVLHAHDFADFSEFTPEEQSRFALMLQRFAERLLIALDRPRQQLALVKLQRWTRLGGFFSSVLILVAAGLFLGEYREQKRDLALDKSYRISSSMVQGCPSPLQYCDETPGYFFHTNEEKEPWVEIDLGKITRLSAVRILNRKDCCFNRASPLLVEVSTDQKQFKKVAEREGVFSSWKAKFAPVEARWVRVRLKGRGILHLSGVRVLP